MTSHPCSRVPWRLALPILALLLAGCLQIETRIVLHEDGSATITETVRFSRALLDLEDKEGGKLRLSPLLEKDAVLERMKQMGKGIRLVSHKVQDAEKGARESVAVFEITDLNDLRYASPFLAFADYPVNNVVLCRLYPLYKSESYAGTAGEMAVVFWPSGPPKGTARLEKGQPQPKGTSPLDLQVYRDLRPVFRDILRDFKIRLTFESYAPLHTGFGLRGQSAGVNYVDLINFTDTDLDRHGGTFLENEEIMTDLIQWKVGSANVVATTSGFTSNLTVPMFLSWGSPHDPWRQGNGIFFRPSLDLFKKHFDGKELDYSRWAPSKDKVPAKFESIGYKKEKRDAEKPK